MKLFDSKPRQVDSCPLCRPRDYFISSCFPFSPTLMFRLERQLHSSSALLPRFSSLLSLLNRICEYTKLPDTYELLPPFPPPSFCSLGFIDARTISSLLARQLTRLTYVFAMANRIIFTAAIFIFPRAFQIQSCFAHFAARFFSIPATRLLAIIILCVVAIYTVARIICEPYSRHSDGTLSELYTSRFPLEVIVEHSFFSCSLAQSSPATFPSLFEQVLAAV